MKLRNLLILMLLVVILTGCKQHHIQVEIMSYNVRHCAGMDLVLDYDRTAAVIARHHPDVVALQELDSMTGRSGYHYQIDELARRTNYHPIFGKAIDYDGGGYGIGLLTREQPLSTRCIPLPGEEPRALLVVELKDYVMACTHLDLEEESRLSSAPLIIEEAKRWEKPFFLSGDWNEVRGSELMNEMMSYFTILSDDHPTYPADEPTMSIDYVALFKGHNAKVLESQVIDEAMASDHRPVVVRVKM